MALMAYVSLHKINWVTGWLYTLILRAKASAHVKNILLIIVIYYMLLNKYKFYNFI